MATVFTIGHSNHPIERFIALLKQHGIATLADIRSRPASRFAAQFNCMALEASLSKSAVAYVYMGDALGGRARSDTSDAVSLNFDTRARDPIFQGELARLVEIATSSRTALMCAEKDPADCHRSFLVGRALRRRGVEIRHIIADGSLREQEAELL